MTDIAPRKEGITAIGAVGDMRELSEQIADTYGGGFQADRVETIAKALYRPRIRKHSSRIESSR